MLRGSLVGADAAAGLQRRPVSSEGSINASVTAENRSGGTRPHSGQRAEMAGSKPLEGDDVKSNKFGTMMVHNKNGLGTIQGVFVPCMLSIVGLVLFMRLGWAIGEAGILGVLSMILFGCGLTSLTVLSLCALATNGKIRGGGAYYLISRSLGPEFGGAIGLIFFAANAVGVAFYMQGFADTLASPQVHNLDPTQPSTRWIKLAMACSCLVVETIIAIVGSGAYAKTAFLIFLLQTFSVCCAGLSVFTNNGLVEAGPWQAVNMSSPPGDDRLYNFSFVGPSIQQFHSNLFPDYSEGNSYGVVFKTIFPALTGIMAGANMSGVLKRPEIAIPRGEMAAVICSTLTYVVIILALGASVPRDTLKGQYLILSQVTWYPAIVTVGIVGSTSAQAFASIQSAARVIQALAMDDLIPLLRPLRTECNDEPVAAIILSVAIAMGFLTLNSIDAIAPILTMFFLLTYWLTNMACFVHRVGGHPNFRPQFRFFTWHTAIVGALLCFGVMWYLEWLSSVIAITILAIIAIYIAKRPQESKGDWGDVSQSLIFHQVRKYLLRLDSANAHVKYWRPQFMVIARGGPCDVVPALEFIDNLKKGGLFMIGDTIPLQNSDISSRAIEQRSARQNQWYAFLKETKFKAFVEVGLERTEQVRDAVFNLLTTTGMGGLKPNTLVMLFPAEAPNTVDAENFSQYSGSQFSDDQESERTIPQRVQHRNLASLSQLLSNSVYDASTSNGCRVTCAFNRELWGVSKSSRPAQQKSLSPTDFVGTLFDAVCAGKHILVLRSMGDLDKHAIANRLGKFSPESQTAWLAELTEEEQLRAQKRRETLNPFVAKSPVQIDVWVLPWTDMSDLMLQLQLSFMLSRDDFWIKHSFIRVCSVVGPFAQLGAKTQEDNVTKDQRRKELYDQVWWRMRIPATIEVFDAVDTVGQDTWAQCREVAHQGTSQLLNVLNRVIRQNNFNTAISVLSLPELPSRKLMNQSDTDSEYLASVQALTTGIGPTMLTRAQSGSRVITTDL